MQYLERNGESKLSKLYIFFAYDFWDMGPQYWFKQFLEKLLKTNT